MLELGENFHKCFLNLKTTITITMTITINHQKRKKLGDFCRVWRTNVPADFVLLGLDLRFELRFLRVESRNLALGVGKPGLIVQNMEIFFSVSAVEFEDHHNHDHHKRDN